MLYTSHITILHIVALNWSPVLVKENFEQTSLTIGNCLHASELTVKQPPHLHFSQRNLGVKLLHIYNVVTSMKPEVCHTFRAIFLYTSGSFHGIFWKQIETWKRDWKWVLFLPKCPLIFLHQISTAGWIQTWHCLIYNSPLPFFFKLNSVILSVSLCSFYGCFPVRIMTQPIACRRKTSLMMRNDMKWMTQHVINGSFLLLAQQPVISPS